MNAEHRAETKIDEQEPRVAPRRIATLPLLLPLLTLLAACKPDPTKVAIQACRDEIPKHTQTSFELDDAKLRAGMKSEAGGVTEFSGLIVFDKSLPSESTQTIVCRAVITTKDDKTSVDVISVQFFPVANK